MRRTLPVAVAAAALCVSQLTTASSHAAPTTLDRVPEGSLRAAVAPAKVRTPFALAGSAYGSRAEGGSLPADSDDTAYERIGCTNLAGDSRVNYEADQVLPGLGKAEGVRTRVWTEKSGGTVTSKSMHSIAKLTIGNPALGAVEIIGLKSVSEAFNRNGRFGTAVDNEVARIVLRAAGQPAQQLAIPAPGRTLTVPGVATIRLGTANRKVTARSARASANVLDVRVLPLGTRVRVSQTNASITKGVEQGVFKGYAAGVEARGLADNLKVGRTPLTLIPCGGGSQTLKGLARVGLGDLGGAEGVASSQRTRNRPQVAQGVAAGRVANVELFDGRVQVNGILGVANVKRERGRLTRSSDGSTVLEVIVDGQSYALPELGSLTIPGLVKLDDRVVVRTNNGLKVIGLRVTVLDGTGAVVDLGVAELGIRPGVRARR